MALTVQSPTRLCSGFKFNSLYIVFSPIHIVIFYAFLCAPFIRHVYDKQKKPLFGWKIQPKRGFLFVYFVRYCSDEPVYGSFAAIEFSCNFCICYSASLVIKHRFFFVSKQKAYRFVLRQGYTEIELAHY
nr:MAG TPA: hypothetical protein [Caudoviricetes sp.]